MKIPPAGSESSGFELGPEVWLLLLGLVATIAVFLVFLFLLRRMVAEDRETRAAEEADRAATREADA